MAKQKMFARAAAVTAAMTLGGAAIVASTGVADAAGRNGKCDTGEFCLYFNSNQKGSLSDFTTSVKDYGAKQPGCYDFKSTGAGKGVCVKNHTASVWNRSSKTVRVYFNSNYGGRYQDFKAGAKGNLNSGLKNQNASHQFNPSSHPAPSGCKTDGTNTKLPSTILVYRETRHKVERVNFKYYVKNVLPKEWMPNWKSESLKSGAMAVKGFGWYHALTSTKKTPWGACYDVTDNTKSQVYVPGSATARTNAAVDATWGRKMTRGGKIFEPHYCQTTTACGRDWVNGEWMSQYGTRDKANAGWGYAKILKAYYRGITIS
ncbi:peptidase inhibitor family I36 protein [Spirillospora sp. NPDC052269]